MATVYGIETLKSLVRGVAQAALLVDEALDGVSVKELYDALQLLSTVQGILKDKDLIVPEYKDLTEAEMDDLIFLIQDEIDFPSDEKVEVVLEKILTLAVSLSDVLKVLGVK